MSLTADIKTLLTEAKVAGNRQERIIAQLILIGHQIEDMAAAVKKLTEALTEPEIVGIDVEPGPPTPHETTPA